MHGYGKENPEMHDYDDEPEIDIWRTDDDPASTEQDVVPKPVGSTDSEQPSVPASETDSMPPELQTQLTPEQISSLKSMRALLRKNYIGEWPEQLRSPYDSDYTK